MNIKALIDLYPDISKTTQDKYKRLLNKYLNLIEQNDGLFNLEKFSLEKSINNIYDYSQTILKKTCIDDLRIIIEFFNIYNRNTKGLQTDNTLFIETYEKYNNLIEKINTNSKTTTAIKKQKNILINKIIENNTIHSYNRIYNVFLLMKKELGAEYNIVKSQLIELKLFKNKDPKIEDNYIDFNNEILYIKNKELFKIPTKYINLIKAILFNCGVEDLKDIENINKKIQKFNTEYLFHNDKGEQINIDTLDFYFGNINKKFKKILFKK